MTSGKVKTLFSDKEKTEALFPRTKTSAVSNEDGIGLDALMENLIYSSNENLNQDTVPLNADTLGGFPAEDYASKLYVKEQILKVQGGTGIDLSEFATKEDLKAINYPVDSVNGKTGTVQLSANDVGALGNNGDQTLTKGTLTINDSTSQGYAFTTKRTVGSDIIESAFGSSPNSAGIWAIKNGTTVNHLSLNSSGSYLQIPLGVDSGGTGANNVADARTNLGAAPAGYGLGELSTSPDDLNTMFLNGFYRVTSAVANNPFTHGAGMVRNYNGSEFVQNIFQTTSGREMVRYTTDGGATWVEEWINPNMSVGTEYRTTERYNGKPVYAKLVDYGALPNATNKNVAHATNVDQTVIYLQGILSNGVVFSTGYNYCRSSPTGKFWVDTTTWSIRLLTEADMSTVTAMVLVKYTK